MTIKMKSKKTAEKKQNLYKKSEIEYITDKKGKKSKVVLPLKTYEAMLEDLHDLKVVSNRKYDKTVSYENVLMNLKKGGLI